MKPAFIYQCEDPLRMELVEINELIAKRHLMLDKAAAWKLVARERPDLFQRMRTYSKATLREYYNEEVVRLFLGS